MINIKAPIFKLESSEFTDEFSKIMNNVSRKALRRIDNYIRTYIGRACKIKDLLEKREIEFLKIPNFGRKSLNALKEALGKFDLSLGMEFNEEPTAEKEIKEIELLIKVLEKNYKLNKFFKKIEDAINEFKGELK